MSADRPTRRRPAGPGEGAATIEDLALAWPATAGSRAARALLDRLDAAGVEVERLEVRTPDLDDVFLALTGRSASQESSENEEADTDQELEAVR